MDVVPSPNVQLKVTLRPSGSVEPALEKLTTNGGWPAVTDAEAIAEGGWLVDEMYRMRRIIAQ